MSVDARRPQVLVDGSRVVLDSIEKEHRTLIGKIDEASSAWTQQLEDGEEPRMSVAEIFLAPRPCRFQPRFHAQREIVRGEPHDVLLVEPVELFSVEHR